MKTPPKKTNNPTKPKRKQLGCFFSFLNGVFPHPAYFSIISPDHDHLLTVVGPCFVHFLHEDELVHALAQEQVDRHLLVRLYQHLQLVVDLNRQCLYQDGQISGRYPVKKHRISGGRISGRFLIRCNPNTYIGGDKVNQAKGVCIQGEEWGGGIKTPGLQ